MKQKLGARRFGTWSVRHGHARKRGVSLTYRSWMGMIDRCTNRKHPRNWKNYGGRGIRVCVRWRRSFAAFLSDMGKRPTKDHSIDRIDNDGDYRPSNCRWATRLQQRQNLRPRKKNPNAKGKLAARFAHRAGHTLRFAAEKFGVSPAAAAWGWKELYPNDSVVKRKRVFDKPMGVPAHKGWTR